ncbi:MAG: hypothetical protein E7K67_11045, partial [Peptostreptococcaceae bacterium]|nr:hypothetical protein [Peptostreptococcaceae bacterium]
EDRNEDIDEETLNKLNLNIKYALNILKPHGINLFLENNSKLDPIFTTTDEIQKIFSQNADLEFLLDIAHIDNINHLQDLINIKYPKILHIADRHFERAKEVLEQVKTLKHTCLDAIYEGDIAFAKGNEEEALTLWHASVTEFPNAWEAYISRGDGFVKLGRYEEAISDYEKCFSLMEKPRYTDPLTFMAKAYELNGDYAKAIETHQRVIKILEQDYNIVSGELVDAPMREIKRLETLI